VIFALESQLSERARKTEDQPWTHFLVSRLVAHSRVPKDFIGSAVSCPRKPVRGGAPTQWARSEQFSAESRHPLAAEI